MSAWSRFQSQFRETAQERRERLRASYKRHLAEHAQKRREECATCPPADAIADERRCTDCPWRSAQ